VEFLPLERLPDGMPHSPTANQILAMSQRAFGPSVSVASARELSGGTFNTTFLITLNNQQVILRIAPSPTADLLWNEQWLMRREQQIQPFFAALAPLMPRTLMADFTRQLIDRDYIFQTFLADARPFGCRLTTQLIPHREPGSLLQFTRRVHRCCLSRYYEGYEHGT
jgi:hypothetical protein